MDTRKKITLGKKDEGGFGRKEMMKGIQASSISYQGLYFSTKLKRFHMEKPKNIYVLEKCLEGFYFNKFFKSF